MRGTATGASETSAAILVGRALACRRGERLVFAGLDLKVAAGELLLLRGPNGSGKSTLLRLIAGLLRPEQGELLWRGQPITDPQAFHRDLAYVGHGDAAKAELTPREDLRFWLAFRGVAPAEAAERAGAALARLGASGLADLPCRLLSAGQKRRLALARVAASGATLWLLDEPFNALDERAVELVQAMLRQHCAAGGLVVMAAHGAVPVAPTHELDLLGAGALAAEGSVG